MVTEAWDIYNNMVTAGWYIATKPMARWHMASMVHDVYEPLRSSLVLTQLSVGPLISVTQVNYPQPSPIHIKHIILNHCVHNRHWDVTVGISVGITYVCRHL